MATVSFVGVGKVYPDGTRALTGFDLEVEDGAFMVFVGPSGCGKTTALRMVAGLEEVSEGELLIDGAVVNGVEPRKRDVAMVFQNYALYPHMTVFENLAFPLQSRSRSKSDVRERVERAASMLGLEELLKRRPRTLSGGQRQRVAMGRALVREPKVFLMDEPLSNLDAKLRVQMRAEIRTLQKELGVTTIYVTHDQIEAMTMGSRVAVLRKGVLQQQGPPQQLYDKPVNLFVATFIGSPAMNLFRARLELVDGGLVCVSGGLRLGLPASVAAARTGLVAGREIALGVRPEHLVDASLAEGDGLRLHGRVQLIEAIGSQRIIHVEIDAQPVLTDEIIEIAEDVDSAALENLRAEAREHKVIATVVFDMRAEVKEDAPIELVVATDHIHFFDLDTGLAIT